MPNAKAVAGRVFLAGPRLGALVGAVLSFGLSLTPSLVPRPWRMQGVVAGIAAALGYALGAALGRLLELKPVRRRLTFLPLKAPKAGLAAGGALFAVLCLGVNFWWQLDVRRLMGMDTGIAYYPFAVTGVALVAGYLLVAAGRAVREAYDALSRLIARLVPRRWVLAARVVVTALLLITFVDVVLGDKVVGAFNEAYVATDVHIDSGVSPPESPYRSGSPDSLTPWDSLGRQGRQFVANGPTLEDLEAFNGEPALEPIRVYAGRATSESLTERAELAVAELERTGGFDRRALVVITTTGTGWVDPLGIDPLEYLLNGDSAAIAVQFSYLPSWAFMLRDQDVARQAGRALFEAVRRRWEQEPEDSRPLLLIFGESLGVFGSESAFGTLEDVTRQTDGVLWVGPPRFSRMWSSFVTGRDPGSPVWHPVYQQGRTVRFGWDHASLTEPDGPWERPRVVYLQNGSDPVTWWTADLLFNRPEWMDKPRSPGISERMFWVPVATFMQVSLDLLVGTQVPHGHGHSFGPAQAAAWALIVEPDGWSEQDTRRLVEFLSG